MTLVALLLLVFGTFRIDPVDVPEHLAVGRRIWDELRPMTTNELSWTYPEHPNEQQYPLYQVVTWLLADRVGFWSLSVFCAVSWFAAVATWARWAGSWAVAAMHAPLWGLAVIGVQRHLVARPEVATLLGLAVLLAAFERWRRAPATWPLVAMVATVWAMVNAHQMYVFGLLLLGGFVVHVAVTRLSRGRGWLDDRDADLPLAPLVVTLLAGIAAAAVSPLGWRAWVAPWALVTTVLRLGVESERVESAELGPIWDDPVGGPLTVVFAAIVGVAGWRARGRWQVLELGVLAMGAGMVAIAMRGIPFFAVAAAAVSSRWWQRAPVVVSPTVSAAAAGATGWLATVLIAAMLSPRPHSYLERQQGLGRSVGEWADEATAFLRADPPPGEMLNIGWVAANYLNFGVYPTRRVFVDGRWEAYPKPFLVETMRMPRDPAALSAMIEQWQPGFAVAEMRDPPQLDRVAELVAAGWGLVYVDSVLAVVVRPTDAGRAYIAEHPLDLEALAVVDALPEHPVLHAQQQIRVAGLLRRLGVDGRAEALRAAASTVDHPAVAADLVTFR